VRASPQRDLANPTPFLLIVIGPFVLCHSVLSLASITRFTGVVGRSKELGLGLSTRVCNSAAQYPRHSRTNGEVRWPRNPAKPLRRFSYQTHPTPRIPKETGPIMSTPTCRVFAPVSQENVAPMLVKTLVFTIADAPFTRRIALCTFATDRVPPFQL
jgi:hypothetical protein